MFPEVYILLIEELVKHCESESNDLDLVSALYRCIPEPNSVDNRWQAMLKPLYEKLMTTAFLYTSNNGGQWIGYQDAVFSKVMETTEHHISEEVMTTVIKVAKKGQQNIVEAPDHILEVVNKYTEKLPAFMSPEHLCGILKTSGDTYLDCTIPEKYQLLEFLVANDQYTLLEELDLLPLADGTFQKFSPGPSCQPVYICTSDELKMFPRLEQQFIAVEIPDTVRQHLEKIITSGTYYIIQVQQIRHIHSLECLSWI